MNENPENTISSSEVSAMQLSRLAGALLLAREGVFILIGDTKEPCDWASAGFDTPAEIEPGVAAVRRLRVLHTKIISISPDLFLKAGEQSMEAVAEILANRFLIRRNASVSERLWRIATGMSEENANQVPTETDASWLVAMPERVWCIVRDAALKCL